MESKGLCACAFSCCFHQSFRQHRGVLQIQAAPPIYVADLRSQCQTQLLAAPTSISLQKLRPYANKVRSMCSRLLS